MNGFTVAGQGGFTACELRGDSVGQLASHIDVAADTPALYAVIGDPSTGRVLDSDVAVLTVAGPDGTRYDTAANTTTHFAAVGSSGRLQALYLLRPQPGRWRIEGSATAPVTFQAMLATVPDTAGPDRLADALATLAPHFPGDTSGPAGQVGFDLLCWGMWPLAVVLVTARATPSLALDLSGVLAVGFGLDPTAAAGALTAMAGQDARGALLTIARSGGLIPPDTTLPVLANGAAADGLAGWQLTANGGDGWAVQSGYAAAIGYRHNFAVSFDWCRKRQTVDLVGAGLTTDFLDTGPVITVTDQVAAPAPDAEREPSSYELTAQLLDGTGAPVKEVTTGTIALPPAGPQARWQRIQVTFDGYGPGVRAVSFAHGGRDARRWNREYGVKMTGADVSVRLAAPGYAPAELLVNGSGQDGTAGWTNTSPSGDSWTVDPTTGYACPASPGTTAFAVAAGGGVKQQVVDLIAAGLLPDFLDTSPTLRAGQWIASAPGTRCDYGFTLELLNAEQAVIATLDSGTVQVASAPRRFVPQLQTIAGYPAGLRSVRFTHHARPAVDGQGPACVAGASVQVLAPQPPPAEPQAPSGPSAVASAVTPASAADPPTRVPNPRSRPYWWVCHLTLYPIGSEGRYLGSGALIPSAEPFAVLTAAHNMMQRWPMTWTGRVEARPGSGSVGRAGGMQLQMPIEYLLRNQGTVSYDGSYDYGLVRFAASDWPAGGFEPTVEDDAATQGQVVTITAYPAEPPFVSGAMYTQRARLSVYDSTQARITTTFTGGASGGPVYIRGTERVVGVFSHGAIFGLATPYLRRLDDQAAVDIRRWARAPKLQDRVCSLQLVIHTGDEAYAGTDDPISLTLGGQVIALDPLWMPMSGSGNAAKERGHFDGYDLSPALRDAFPDGLTVGSLRGLRYELRLMSRQSWLSGDWFVSSLNFYVNGHRYHLQNTDAWLSLDNPDWNVIAGTLP